jgi:2-polyprenyl-3-methyl-5-hydroxy-6-metoxy-1,4-benzoquinol methylase
LIPDLQSSQYFYRDVLKTYVQPGCRWLDVGCGRGIFPEWMRAEDQDVVLPGVQLTGIDADFASLQDNTSVAQRVAGKVEAAPFASQSFDLITANMVFEHVEHPEAALRNFWQLLKPGGLVIFHTPNLLHYQTILASLVPQRLKNFLAAYLEDRPQHDVFPTHYRFNTRRRILGLSLKCGFQVRELHLVNSTPTTIHLGSLVLAELLTIRVLNSSLCRDFRSNIIAVLERNGESPRNNLSVEPDVGYVESSTVSAD